MEIYLEAVSTSAILPVKGTVHAACYDLSACLEAGETLTMFTDMSTKTTQNVAIVEGKAEIVLPSGYRILIPTGWKMRCPEGYSIDFLPRSGLAVKEGISVVNTPGVIDHDYSNQCFVALVNLTNHTVVIEHGQRIAQMRLVPVLDTTLIEAPLPAVQSDRTGGFGSTGK